MNVACALQRCCCRMPRKSSQCGPWTRARTTGQGEVRPVVPPAANGPERLGAAELRTREGHDVGADTRRVAVLGGDTHAADDVLGGVEPTEGVAPTCPEILSGRGLWAAPNTSV
jgi:hypothetical protein